MKKHNEKRGERRSGTRQMVRDLLAERQEMLVAYCRLAGLEPYTPDKPVKQQLDEFCQLLMDYAAYGHFELYQRIVEGGERRAGVIRTAERVYPSIAEATEYAVAFNDKYDASTHALAMKQLPVDLSSLGVHLATRLELEDRLLQALMHDPGEGLDMEAV